MINITFKTDNKEAERVLNESPKGKIQTIIEALSRMHDEYYPEDSQIARQLKAENIFKDKIIEELKAERDSFKNKLFDTLDNLTIQRKIQPQYQVVQSQQQIELPTLTETQTKEPKEKELTPEEIEAEKADDEAKLKGAIDGWI